jgi:hypothetical protein
MKTRYLLASSAAVPLVIAFFACHGAMPNETALDSGAPDAGDDTVVAIDGNGNPLPCLLKIDEWCANPWPFFCEYPPEAGRQCCSGEGAFGGVPGTICLPWDSGVPWDGDGARPGAGCVYGVCAGACTLDQAASDPWPWPWINTSPAGCVYPSVGCGYVVFGTGIGDRGDGYNYYFDQTTGQLVAIVDPVTNDPRFRCIVGPASGLVMPPCVGYQGHPSSYTSYETVCDPCNGPGGSSWCDAGAQVVDAGTDATDAPADAASD